MKKQNKGTPYKTKIGGQALIEGVMMRGVDNAAMAVRNQEGEITVEEWGLNQSKFMKTVSKIPIVRGVFNFISSIVSGYKCLTKSMDLSGMTEMEEDYEPSKFEKWLDKTFGDKLMKGITVFATVLGVFLAVVLFIFVPSLIVKFIDRFVALGGFKSLIEGVIKIIIFVTYLALVSRMKEIRRTFEYHGAEHKTIFCYEYGEELTVENVKKQSRFHPRCGTSFLVLLLIISILASSFVSWNSLLLRTVIKIALLPVVMGIGYELLKLAGRYDNIFTRIISFPGLKLQHLTTKEPDESQIEVAIEALKPVLPKVKDEDKW